MNKKEKPRGRGSGDHHSHTPTPKRNTTQKTREPEDASFKQLHILHKEHPQSSIRAGEV